MSRLRAAARAVGRTVAKGWAAFWAPGPHCTCNGRDEQVAALEVARRLMVEYFGPGKSSAVPADWVIDAMIEFASSSRRQRQSGRMCDHCKLTRGIW